MVRLRRANLRIGAVVRVPISPEHFGLALAVARIEPLLWYLAAYPGAFGNGTEPDLTEATRGTPIALTLTMDVLIRHGDWDVMGDAPVDYSTVLLPAYKTTVAPDRFVVCDYQGNVKRPATPTEIAELPYRVDSAPVSLEELMAHHHDGTPLNSDHEALAPVPWERSSQALFGDPS